MDAYDRDVRREIRRLDGDNRALIWLKQLGKLIWDWWAAIIIIVLVVIAITNLT